MASVEEFEDEMRVERRSTELRHVLRALDGRGSLDAARCQGHERVSGMAKVDEGVHTGHTSEALRCSIDAVFLLKAKSLMELPTHIQKWGVEGHSVAAGLQEDTVRGSVGVGREIHLPTEHPGQRVLERRDCERLRDLWGKCEGIPADVTVRPHLHHQWHCMFG